MASSDDAVREINLSGKQLVFLFMAVTVVSVVIFLCGVLVGRGVQLRIMEDASTAVVDETVDVPPADIAPGAAPSEPTKPTGLEYPERLEAAGPVAETLTPRDAAPKPAPTPTAPAAPAPAASAAESPRTTPPAETAKTAAASPPTPAAKDVAPLPPEPIGDGFAIQVAALKGRDEAEGVVVRLKQKGYSAYLLPPLAGQPSVFRVRVGKFKGRAEAEQIATRLEREEQFKPWITR